MATDNSKQQPKENEHSANGRRQRNAADKREQNGDILTVEITRFKPLIDVVSDRKRMARVALLITLITCLIFIGLLVVTLTIKRVYPYSDIQINTLGATTIRDEKKEVTYWLFNTAELWANSGIMVNEGDILNIRASGLSHTAIHHLVDDVSSNNKLRDPWSGTQGVEIRATARDQLRTKWSIVPHQPTDALVMQIIENESSDPGSRSGLNPRYLTSVDSENGRHNDIYLIGKERTELRVNKSGYLHFAVNDIVLTPRIIYNMIWDNIDKMTQEYDKRHNTHTNNAFTTLHELQHMDYDSTKKTDENIVKATDKFYKAHAHALLNIQRLDGVVIDAIFDECNRDAHAFGPYPDSERTTTFSRNEMTYYLETDYVHAWYDDNVGSFLIVIERKRD